MRCGLDSRCACRSKLNLFCRPTEAEEYLLRAGKELDKHYIPSRYPNAFPQGAPCDYYTKEEAQRAITHTEHILAFCEALLAEP